MPQIIPRFDFRVRCAACEDMGGTRTNQEDVHLVAPEQGLFVVADGMGGHAAGEVAAQLAVDGVQEALASRDAQRVGEAYFARPSLKTRRGMMLQLERAVQQAHAGVVAAAAENPDRKGMGCTLDVLWLARDRAFLAHVGDGRAYLARPTAFLQLTQDHVKGEKLKAEGVVRPTIGPAWGFERLVNAIGVTDTVSVDTLFVDVNRGDRLLLCSDGVYGPIGDEAALSKLLRQGSAQQAACTLVKRAIARGRDNATAVVVEIGDCLVQRASGDRGLSADDLERARRSVLLVDLPDSAVLGALAAAVEVELPVDATVPCVVANDLVAYVVLEGVVHCCDDRSVGTGALLFPESLLGVWDKAPLPVVQQPARLLRVRADDFQEVCDGDVRLGMQLYRRIAKHLARVAVGQRPMVTAASMKPPAPAPESESSDEPKIPRPPGVPKPPGEG